MIHVRYDADVANLVLVGDNFQDVSRCFEPGQRYYLVYVERAVAAAKILYYILRRNKPGKVNTIVVSHYAYEFGDRPLPFPR